MKNSVPVLRKMVKDAGFDKLRKAAPVNRADAFEVKTAASHEAIDLEIGVGNSNDDRAMVM